VKLFLFRFKILGELSSSPDKADVGEPSFFFSFYIKFPPFRRAPTNTNLPWWNWGLSRSAVELRAGKSPQQD